MTNFNERNHRISANDILKEGQSTYSLVIAIAKRAREIAEEAEEQGDILVKKPVQMAVEEFAKGKYIFNESEECNK